MSEERDWADLPAELIHLISKKLPDLCDFIRFRAVCKSWCSSAPLSDPPPQLPWLLESRYGNMAYLEEELRFCALSTGRIGIIRPEKPRQCDLFYSGPCCGYLLTTDPLEADCVSLFNPLTNVDISLPSFKWYISWAWPVWTGSDPISSRTIVFVERDPDTINEIGSWAVYHPGKTDWIVTKGFYYNCCYWNGMFFSTVGDADTVVFDVTSQKLLYNSPSPDASMGSFNGIWPRSYVVELSGVIIKVCWYLDRDRDVEEPTFRIYKFNFEGRGGQPCWVEISNIDNHMVFLDYRNAFSLKPIAGFKGNCIYFFNRKDGTPDRPCRYDIADGTLETIPCPFEACTWFVPSLL